MGDPNEKRIYVVVADSVQNPLAMRYGITGKFLLLATPETHTIVQPRGRIAAQVGHVVSRMRMHRLEEMHVALREALATKKPNLAARLSDAVMIESSTPVTTIILGVPDSYQLAFRLALLRKAGVPVHSFFDTNEEYGLGSVMTAICTEPIKPEKLDGALDYLALWS